MDLDLDLELLPALHKIVLRVDQNTALEDIQDKVNQESIACKDDLGRTALDWAVACGQIDVVELLIQHGSDVNTMDNYGRTTLQHAVDSHSPEIMRMILEAGGDPNPIFPKHVHRSSPLTAACSGGLESMIEMLVAERANLEAVNPEGLTPLHLQEALIEKTLKDLICKTSPNSILFDYIQNGLQIIEQRKQKSQ